jgi:zinc protease
MTIDWNVVDLPLVVDQLTNGLTVIVHTERRSPLAAVYVGYRAGSREEPPSKAGLAHLCEHLMFCGTRRNPGSYFAPFEQAGASSMNAFVREDYSAYFATVPATALDFAMSLEADRMANVAEVLDDERVDRQRDVVGNELRQRENQPYGCTARLLAELAHPSGHPYAHLPDGLISELDNISINDVRDWVELRHSPATATLIVAGDVEPGVVIEQAKRHFGSLVSSRAAEGCVSQTSGGHSASRRDIELPVMYGKLCIAWNGPSLPSVESSALEIACEVMAGTKNSRLWRRIVQSERLASSISIEVRPRQLGMLIILTVTARAGVPLSAIEEIVRGEIRQLFARGPDPRELETARFRLFGKMVRGFERIGGPDGKSDMLGLATIVYGKAESHRNRLSSLASTQPATVAAASRWMADAGAVLKICAVG